MHLASHTSFGVGGCPLQFLTPQSVRAVRNALEEASAADSALHVLGAGTNTLFADGNLDLVVMRPSLAGIHCDASVLTASAGTPWDAVVSAAVDARLQGIECLSGIPGTVGASPVHNIGAYGQQVSDTIASVSVYDRESHDVRELSADACHFGYRTSIFMELPDRYVILTVSFALAQGGLPHCEHTQVAESLGTSPSLQDVRDVVLGIRKRKGMLAGQVRSAGSFFMNPVVPSALAETIAQSYPTIRDRAYWPQEDGVKLSAAFLMEASGVERGYTRGRAGTSPHHVLALVAHEGATAHDVTDLARYIQERVRSQFGILLHPEVGLIGFAEYPLLR